MTRFLHTADWHIGRACRFGPDSPAIPAEVRLQTARRIIEQANERQVDFILIAGDLFQSADLERTAVRDLVELLGTSKSPIAVIPGNHDPMRPGSLWSRTEWQSRPENVLFLSTAQTWSPSQNVAVFPCPITQKAQFTDPTESIPTRTPGDKQIRIGLAHGSIGSVPDANFPIAHDRPQQAGLDYLALGDWHSTRILDRAAYPGTPEPTNYKEKSAGNVLLVEIEQAGAQPKVEAFPVAQLHWHDFEESIRDEIDAEKLVQQLKALGPPASLVLSVSLQFAPSLPAAAVSQIEGLKQDLERTCPHLAWKQDRKALLDAHELIPEGVLRRIYENLLAEADESDEHKAAALDWMADIAEAGQ